MIELPIWTDCRRCQRLKQCPTSFPANDQCAYPDDHSLGAEHTLVISPTFSNHYSRLLDKDAEIASVFHRWRRGIIPSDADFLLLRERALHADHFMKGDAPIFMIRDILHEPQSLMAQDYIAYYLRPSNAPHDIYNSLRHVTEVELSALGLVVYNAWPLLIAENARMGSEWSRFVLDQVKLLLWHLLGCKHPDLSSLSDRDFRQRFEKEWKELLQYQDSFYGFRIIPKLSLKDMERYQALKHGNPEIRRAISIYITHQATEYPHLFKPYAPNITEVAYERRLRRLYDPLINAIVNQALNNIEATYQDRKRLRPDVLKQVEEVFLNARQNFSFYWEKSGQQRPAGKQGLVGFPQNSKDQAAIDELLKQRGIPFTSRDFMEVSFATYIRQQLRSWLNRTYGPDKPAETPFSLQQTVAQGSMQLEDRIAETAGAWDEANQVLRPSIVATDGTGYFTIQQAAQYHGLTVDQLRWLDREGILPAQRVDQVFSLPYPQKPKVRIYPATEEMRKIIQTVKARLAKHSSHLQGEELDRNTAASMLGVPVTVLRKLESKGELNPPRRGRIVVYDASTLAQAYSLLKKDP
jgi:hypothetical protein